MKLGDKHKREIPWTPPPWAWSRANGNGFCKGYISEILDFDFYGEDDLVLHAEDWQIPLCAPTQHTESTEGTQITPEKAGAWIYLKDLHDNEVTCVERQLVSGAMCKLFSPSVVLQDGYCYAHSTNVRKLRLRGDQVLTYDHSSLEMES